MPKKYTFEEAKQIVENRGLYLLQDYYTNNRTKILVSNDFGYKGFTTLDNIISGKQPSWVYKGNPYSIQNIQLFLDSKKEGTKLLSSEYKNQKQKLKLQCKCGKIYYKTWSDLINETYTSCNDCIAKTRGQKRQIDYEELKIRAEENGLFLLENSYNGYEHRIKVVDKDGYMGRLSARSIISGRSFAKFNSSKNGEYYVHNLNVWAKENGQNIEVLEVCPSNEWSTKTLYCRCLECGKEFICPSATFFYGKIACDDCTKLYSRYSTIVADWLDSQGINYKREKKFKDCVYKKPLPFDFYIERNNLCIEVDGEGHYYPVQFKGMELDKAQENFRLTKIRDNIKDEYCNSYNINLIRIPYWEINNGNFKNKINDFLTQHTKD